MKTYREFIAEVNAAHPDIANQPEFQKKVEKILKQRRTARSAAQKIPSTTSGTKPQPTQGQPFKPTGKPGSPGNVQTGYKKPGFKTPNVKVPTGVKNVAGFAGRAAGPALTAVDAALTYKGRRSEGESRKRAAAGTAVEVGSGLAGAELGAQGGAVIGGTLGSIVPGPGTAIGAGVGGLVGGGVGYVAGSEVGKKAFDVAAGATPQQKKAMATANRQRQAGTGIVGTGGPTKVDTKKNTITTGGKTVALPKMQVNPQTGKAGYLAYKGGQATYKTAADPSTLAKTSSNPLERLGRTINPGAYAKQDAAAKAAQLKQAQAGTASYKKSLGIK
jgi:hypothetical protein